MSRLRSFLTPRLCRFLGIPTSDVDFGISLVGSFVPSMSFFETGEFSFHHVHPADQQRRLV